MEDIYVKKMELMELVEEHMDTHAMWLRALLG